MRRRARCSSPSGSPSDARPDEAADRRLILVTLDGLHWTEVFRGADKDRAADKEFVAEPDAIARFVGAPATLTPFLHGVAAKDGALIGDRDTGSCAAVGNQKWFSYPGYNEVLTGKPDEAITSNEHGPNGNVTFLEWLNRSPAYVGKVAVVGSWGALHEIVNDVRSGVPVNAGPRPVAGRDAETALLARLQADAPGIWRDTRFDAFTHAFALDALRHDKPAVLYVAYGETDDLAHEGRYDQALLAANRADRFIAELWRTAQADPAYAGKTTLIVTVDHGRGSHERGAWKSHGKPQWPGSDQVWIAVLGPGVKPLKLAPGACASSSQIAATALTALGEDWKAYDPTIAPPLDVFGH